MMHPFVRLIGGLAGAVLAAVLFAAPASAASVINPFARTSGFHMPPAGITLTEGARTNALMLQASVRTEPRFLRQVVNYRTQEKPGTIVVNTGEKYLYLVLGNGWALRYGIGVARDGFEWSGTHRITAQRKWPDWTPPAEMLKRQPGIPTHMAGGKDNPLGARALYIGATLYRIHGTNQPWTIGHNVSSGCIRMTNADVIDLYARVKIGAKVVVL